MISIFTGSQWSTSPKAYWTIQYEYRRSGADMQYRFYWKVWLGSASWFYDGLQLQLFLGGSQKNITVKGYNANEKGWSYEGTTGWYTVANKTSGTTSFYAKLYDTNAKTTKVTSSTGSLAVSPAYATANQSLSSKTETSIKMSWTSDNTIDYIWYSKDGGTNWTGIDVTDGKSGSYTISGLSANTTYSIKTRVRRKDSQLKTDSTALSVTTYDYPYCTSTPNFTIGDAVKLTFYNPLGRSITFKIIANGITYTDSDWKTSGTSYTGLNHSITQGKFYSSIPTAKSGKYQVVVTYGSIVRTRNNGNTFKIKGTEIPSGCTLTYKDTNSAVVGVTGNDQLIVQNQSNLQVTYTEAKPNNGASSIAKYTFELNGVTKTSTAKGGTVDFGKVNSSTNLTLKLTIEDSRGLKSSQTLFIDMCSYSKPVVKVILERLNNYEDETYLTANPTISSIDGKNTMTISFKYKRSGYEYGSSMALTKGVQKTVVCDKNYSYVFSVTVTDKFTSTTKEFELPKGKFPLFIDTSLNAVGINEFPKEGEALNVSGGKSYFESISLGQRWRAREHEGQTIDEYLDSVFAGMPDETMKFIMVEDYPAFDSGTWAGMLFKHSTSYGCFFAISYNGVSVKRKFEGAWKPWVKISAG